MRRFVLLSLLPLLSAVLVFAGSERSFELVNRSAVEALPLIEPLLSPNGTMMLRPGKNILVVKDNKENLEKVGRFLATWDVALRRFRVQVTMILSTPGKPTDQVPEGLDRQVYDDLTKFLPNKSFKLLDTIKFSGTDGSTLESPAGRQYVIRFTLRADSTDENRVMLSPFELLRASGLGGMPDKMPFMSTGCVLFLGQPYVWSVGRDIGDSRSLLLVFLAGPEERK